MKATRLVAAVLIVLIAIFIYFTPQKLRPQLEAKQTDIPQDLPQIYPYPLRNENFQEAPQISAWSAVVVDAKSGVALYEKNADTRHLPASTTKLMTALAALEQCAPDQPVTVKTFETLPTSMGLVTGDIVTVRTLLYGLLINSGNDAASVLSYSCAPSSGDFVRRMNQKALEFGMHQTHFANPIGFDDPAQFTTARDLAKLARIAVANPLIAKIVATKNMVLTDVAGTKNYYL